MVDINDRCIPVFFSFRVILAGIVVIKACRNKMRNFSGVCFIVYKSIDALSGCLHKKLSSG